jgi:hypothetical protein
LPSSLSVVREQTAAESHRQGACHLPSSKLLPYILGSTTLPSTSTVTPSHSPRATAAPTQQLARLSRGALASHVNSPVPHRASRQHRRQITRRPACQHTPTRCQAPVCAPRDLIASSPLPSPAHSPGVALEQSGATNHGSRVVTLCSLLPINSPRFQYAHAPSPAPHMGAGEACWCFPKAPVTRKRLNFGPPKTAPPRPLSSEQW